MKTTQLLIVSGIFVSLAACDGEAIKENSSSTAVSSLESTASSSSTPAALPSGNSSSSSSSLGIGECPPGFDFTPEVAVMDIELRLDNDNFTWDEFALAVIMPRLEVAQNKHEKARSKWAISFNLFSKAHACSLPYVTLNSYVQSFEVRAIQGDTLVNLTPYMAATNTSESGRLIAGDDDSGTSYPLTDWNGLSKQVELGQGSSSYYTEDTELTLSFNRAPPIPGESFILEVEATFNDGSAITRRSDSITLNEQ